MNSASNTPMKTAYDRRWIAKFKAEFYAVKAGTQMGKSMHYGPLRVQRPFFPEGAECLHMYLLHPPGGLVGGDQLSINLNAGPGAHFLLTTPSAGKLYRNISGLNQGQFVDIKVADNAIAEYLPQENIVFNGAEGELDTRVNIEGNGIFSGWEITCLGRHESEESFAHGCLKQSLSIFKNQRPLFMDRLLLNAPASLQNSKAGLQACCVYGTFVITLDLFPEGKTQDVKTENLMQEIRQWLANFEHARPNFQISFTQKPGIWIVRALANRVECVRNAFEFLWAQLRPIALNRQACAPRIWST